MGLRGFSCKLVIQARSTPVQMTIEGIPDMDMVHTVESKSNVDEIRRAVLPKLSHMQSVACGLILCWTASATISVFLFQFISTQRAQMTLHN
jgi:hypothetical protein